MSRFEFSLATHEDDDALRALLAATPMDGDISLAFRREPSYFTAAAVDGQFVQVVAVRDRESSQVVGMGSRATTSCYVNGRIQSVGYLSGLRGLPQYRARAGLLARGYRFLRELHVDGRAPFYLTTIAEGNHLALKLLTSQRAGLPVYHPLGRYYTLTLATTGRRDRMRDCAIRIRTATPDEAHTLAEFLHEVGPQRQFFPAYDEGDFGECPRRLVGLTPESILMAYVDDQLMGTLGVWDQRSFKQTSVEGYSKRLELYRPIYNGYAALRARPRLPRIGESLNMRFAALPVVVGNDRRVTRALIAAAVQLVREQDGRILLLGLHESDPLLPHVRDLSGRAFNTWLYLVFWDDERPDIEALTQRVPYLELGCL